MLSSGNRGRGGVTGRGGGKSSSLSPIFVKKLPGCFGAFPSVPRDGGSGPPGFFATIGPNDFGLGSAWFSRVLVNLFADVALAGPICGVGALGAVNGFGVTGWGCRCAVGDSAGLLVAAGCVGFAAGGSACRLNAGGSGLLGSTGAGGAGGGISGGGVGVGNG